MRDCSTGAYNHCEKVSWCRLDHYFYNANTAQEAYLFHLSDSRQGVNLSETERSGIAQTIAKPLKAGQSLYQILTTILSLVSQENPFIHTLKAEYFKNSALITSHYVDRLP